MTNQSYDMFLEQELPTKRELLALFDRKDPLVIFDIGACEGEDSIRYARLFPRARIFSFEPMAGNQSLIRHHFERHQVKQCELVPLALSDRQGEAVLHVSSGAPPEKTHGEDWNYGNKSSSLLPPGLTGEELFPWLSFEKTESVQTDTLDHFCELRGLSGIDFIHMDVQGAESLVLQGARNLLPATKAVWLEVAARESYKGQKLKGEIESLMREAGFGLTYQRMSGIEGDQFYVNLRFRKGRIRFWLSPFTRGIRFLKRAAAHILRKLSRKRAG
jgi:FkbM family methyltransferase